MQRISMIINTTNAAFDKYPLNEAARILQDILHDWNSDKEEYYRKPTSKADINGNVVCFITYEE